MHAVQTLNVDYMFRLFFTLFIAFGGLAATLTVVRNTRGSLERRFMRRCVLSAWLVLVVFLWLLIALPEPWGYVTLIPYGLHLPFAVYLTTQKQQVIRRYERGLKADDEDE